MIFKELKLQGVFIIEPEKRRDDRGYFARTWCQREFETHGLNSKLVQCNVSFNNKKGTLRGMHYQVAPHAEAKLVRCTRGAIFDVIIDLRENASSYKQWLSVELSEKNTKLLYIPEGFAHGFSTLESNTEVFYQMSESYHPECVRGIRWNDPVFDVAWPADISVISEKDANYSDFQA